MIPCWLRSVFFVLGFWPATVLTGLAVPFVLPLPYEKRYAFLGQWAGFTLWWLRKTCGIEYRVEGMENLPDQPAVVLSKHQSSWETIAVQQIFPRQVWLLKRELLWVPFFGWALASLGVIAIDRGSPRKALQQLLSQGEAYLRQGRWVIIFPEGTRIAPGERGKYNAGGALLAEKTDSPVVPVAHNAGLFWPRGGFVKQPGVIRVRIGPPVYPRGKKASEIIGLVEEWIERNVRELEKV